MLPTHRADPRGPRARAKAKGRRSWRAIGTSSEAIHKEDTQDATRVRPGRRRGRRANLRRAHRLDPRRRPPRPRPPGFPRRIPPPVHHPHRPVLHIRSGRGVKHNPRVPAAGPRSRPRTPRRAPGTRRGPRGQSRVPRRAHRAHRAGDRRVFANVQKGTRMVPDPVAQSRDRRGARRGRHSRPRVVRTLTRVRGRRGERGERIPDHHGEVHERREGFSVGGRKRIRRRSRKNRRTAASADDTRGVQDARERAGGPVRG